MRRLLLTAIGIVSLVAVGAPRRLAARDDSAATPAADRDPLGQIQKLIADLGSDEYSVRRRAEEQLIRLGPLAFDELKLAENHPDLEVSERVRYIVQQMHVEWTRPDDSADVRRLLVRYGDLSEDNRRGRIRQLAELPDGHGLAALCRIARFDPSPLVARRAALAVLQAKRSSDASRALAIVCQQELGTSRRAPVLWIRLCLREMDEPRGTIAEWTRAVSDEAELFQSGSRDTDFSTVYDVLERHLERCHDLRLTDETTKALVQVINAYAHAAGPGADDSGLDPAGQALTWAVRWIIQHERWDVLPQIEDRFDAAFRASRRLLYYLAAAIDRAGGAERGRELADRAFGLKGEDEDERVEVAEAVASLGRIDWAEREYRRTIELFPVLDSRSVVARSGLAMWLHDREDYQGAADLLGEFCDIVDADRAAKQRVIEALEAKDRFGRLVVNGILARWHFYLACADGARGRHDRQREQLRIAAAMDQEDPDILIAMYRARKKGDDDFRQYTRSRIRTLARSMQQQIDEYPDEPSKYNQWAWLIANTEGDRQKAVEYSRRALELAPDEPSYLDTLARCYFAVGELELAVENQRKAVKLAPHYQVMRRQLDQFERALAKQEKQETAESSASAPE
jgi:tetratricopeptide (TPR) repeat protein